MKTFRHILTLGVVAALLGAAQIARADTATGNATATIVPALTMAQAAGNFLNFGRIAQSATPGYVTISENGTRWVTGLQVISGSAVSPAIFNFTGDPGAAFFVTLPTSATLTRYGGAETMTVTNFVVNISGQMDGTGILDAGGFAQGNIGATLNVDANQPIGVYDGTFAVVYAYN